MIHVRKIGWIIFIALSLSIIISPLLAQEETRPAEGDISKIQQKGLTLWETIKAGGWIMVVLLGMSIVGVAVIIDSFITLNEKKFIPLGFVREIKGDLDKGTLGIAVDRCEKNPGALSSILKAGFTSFDKGFEHTKESMQTAGEIETENIMQRISSLSIIATLAPMLGLLGTVLGMIEAFNTIALESALGKPQLLALSISKALITTAGGLIVALPTMGFYFYFRGKGTKIIMKLEAMANSLINELKGREVISSGENRDV